MTSVLVPTPAEDVLHGVRVPDPYRWLEDRGSPETEEWILSQKARLDSYFSNLPGLDALRLLVSEFLNMEVIDQVTQVGKRSFYRRRAKTQEQACIWVKDKTTNEERVLVDPNQQGQFVSARLHIISDSGSLLAYELRHGGGDAAAIHIVDTVSGQTLPEHLDTGYCRGLVFRTDNTAFYSCHEHAGAIGDHTISRRKFARGVEEDLVVSSNAHTEKQTRADV